MNEGVRKTIIDFKNELEARGQWESFDRFAYSRWIHDNDYNKRVYTSWLLNEERFFHLLAEWQTPIEHLDTAAQRAAAFRKPKPEGSPRLI